MVIMVYSVLWVMQDLFHQPYSIGFLTQTVLGMYCCGGYFPKSYYQFPKIETLQSTI